MLASCFLIVLQISKSNCARKFPFQDVPFLLHNSIRYDLFIIYFLFLFVYEFVCVRVLKFVAFALV